jgi:outer membrane lipoprotein-sorting protein
MKKVKLLSAIIALVIVLAACGSKGVEDVLGDLAAQLESLESYEMKASLVLQTGMQPEEHQISIAHKKPHYYRIGITNKEREITQIILRNDEGVFVLTPHLKKSFRFQSGWPENQGQVYLYESLIYDILADENRSFTAEGDGYMFETATNYQNKTLAHQKIWLDKDLRPQKVEVYDANYTPLVELTFSEVAFNVSFEGDAFDMDRNMTGALLESMPVLAEAQQVQGSFGIYEPSYMPPNVELVEAQEFTQNGHQMVVLRYDGDYRYTIIQERPRARVEAIPAAVPVDLNLDFTIGVKSDSSLHWFYDGIEFTLSSDNLPLEEKMAIAHSIAGQASK